MKQENNNGILDGNTITLVAVAVFLLVIFLIKSALFPSIPEESQVSDETSPQDTLKIEEENIPKEEKKETKDNEKELEKKKDSEERKPKVNTKPTTTELIDLIKNIESELLILKKRIKEL